MHASEIFEEATAVSDLMGRENHIFTVVPRADVENALDWRLPVFEADRYLVAFDGAAFLLMELWRRRSQEDSCFLGRQRDQHRGKQR